MKENIVLIGMPGTFKTTAGRILSKRLNMYFADTDDMFEYEYMSIKDAFGRFGEQFFREGEERIVKRVAGFSEVIISTGGGVVLNSLNMQRLRETGVVVQLKCLPEVICKRVTSGKEARPLIGKRTALKNIKDLLAARQSLYDMYCDATVDTTELDGEGAADKIAEALLKLYRMA